MKRAAGLTLVELVLALGLLALLMLAVFQLFDRSLAVWRMGETRRALLEVASTVNLELGRDLRGIESGPRGDFVFEWVSFDTDGDGGRETKWPRLRLVRQASAAEVARLQREERIALEPRSAAPSDEPERFERASAALVEVVWMVAPASLRDKDARAEGRLWRGERLVSDATSKSFFDADFFGTSNLPPAGATDEVTGGCLWMNLSFAAQTSVVHDGWRRANDLAGAAATWDAWGRNRPDPGVHPWNERHVGMPAARAGRARVRTPRRPHPSHAPLGQRRRRGKRAARRRRPADPVRSG